MFIINEDELYKVFPMLYLKTMHEIGAEERFFFREDDLKKLMRLTNCMLFGIKVEGVLKIIHFVGFNTNKKRADFVFSAFEESGRIFSTPLVWKIVTYLKQLGVNHYHLGGGMRENDGLDNFKRQFGGDKLYNGGLKIVVDSLAYEER